MSRLIQFILLMISLLVLAPAQAMLNIDAQLDACQAVAADESGGDKKDGDKKEGEEEEEEEPDCD